MKAKTAQQIASAIQMMYLDGIANPNDNELAKATGVNRKTIQRHKQLITVIKFALDRKSFDKCVLVTTR
ncbi:MAG: hypothetical protein EOM50_14010 [Erysipelotrichia bacterium]|nr:hypothetical protein [Erysipelotrichia bacterium]